jgi:hypothetical protein
MLYHAVTISSQELNARSTERHNLNSLYSEVSDDSEREIDQTSESQRL